MKAPCSDVNRGRVFCFASHEYSNAHNDTP